MQLFWSDFDRLMNASLFNASNEFVQSATITSSNL